MDKKDLPISLTPSERSFGLRYLLFSLIFLGSILSLLSGSFSWFQGDTAYFITNFLAVCLIFRRFLLASFRVGFYRFEKVLLAGSLAILAYFAASKGMDLLYRQIMPGYFNVNDADIYQTALIRPWSTIFCTVILVPIAEETLHRGLVFGALHRTNRTAAYVISSILFCYIHIAGYIGVYEAPVLLLCFLQYLPAGLALAWSYEFSGSILTPILMHTAVNAIAMFLMR